MLVLLRSFFNLQKHLKRTNRENKFEQKQKIIMLRRTNIHSLRHVTTIIPKAGNSVQRVSRISSDKFVEYQQQSDKLGGGATWYDNVMSETQLKNLVSLRVGGAKVLAPANRPMLVQPEKSPLHFSPVRPRDAGLCQALCAALARLKIKKLTELQGALIPILLRGRHVIGHSETGSGKSFGIALAACNRMLREQTNNRLHTMILVPTDALALQYERWLRHFAGSSRQIVLAAVSQYPLEHQLAQLHNVQPHVIVGTPQRLADIASLCPVIIGEKLRKKVDCIVLDEVDVLLNTPITPPSQEDKVVASRFEKSLTDQGLGKNSSAIETCSELIDRLYRSEMTELPAQIVAVSATVDGDSAARLNTWMRNDKVTRLTTSIEEQSIPDTLSFYFCCENETQNFPMHRLLELFLQHIACQTSKPRLLIFVDENEFELNDMVRYVSELRKFPTEALASLPSSLSAQMNNNNNRWNVVSLQKDFEEQDHQDQAALNVDGDENVYETNNNDDDDQNNSPRQHQHQQEKPKSIRPKKQPIKSTLSVNRRIIGRNGEIFCFDDSNLSKLESYQAQVGIAPFSLARGLHIANVSHVIIFGNCPGVNEFLHCAGRTGRCHKSGEVINIFSPVGGRQLKSIADTLNIPWHVVRPSDVEKNLVHSIDEFAKKMTERAASAAATAVKNKQHGVLSEIFEERKVVVDL